eukprot:3874201-Amphidinium_carterae.1
MQPCMLVAPRGVSAAAVLGGDAPIASASIHAGAGDGSAPKRPREASTAAGVQPQTMQRQPVAKRKMRPTSAER